MASDLRIEFVGKEEMKLVGFSEFDSLNHILKTERIGKLREQLARRVGEIENRTDDGIYLVQVYADNPNWNPEQWTPDMPFRHIVAVQVSAFGQMARDMVTHTVPGGRYMTFIHQGPESTIGNTYDHVIGWLEQNNYEHAHYDFEYWPDITQLEKEDSEIVIYKPVVQPLS